MLKTKLEDVVEPDYELLPQLLSTEVLADREYHVIKCERTVHGKVGKLVNCLSNKSEALCERFLVALKTTKQEHVVHFIRYPNGALSHRKSICFVLPRR
jgi:hypothetical protein